MTNSVQAIEAEFPGLLKWLADGERGLSSETLVARTTGISLLPRRRWTTPADISDFRRCRLLLDAVPSLREHLHLMCDVSPAWARMGEEWDDICSEIDADVVAQRTHGHAPTAHTRIRKCNGWL